MVDIKEYKEKEKELRSGFIIDAAEKLFFTRGYDAVSMDDIAANVGLTKAALYRYFENKEDLFFAIVLRGTQILSAMFEKSIQKIRDGRRGPGGPNRAYFEFVKKYPGYHRMILYYQSGRFDLKNTAQNGNAHKIADLRKKIFLMLEEAVQDEIRSGRVRPDIKPVEAVVLMTVIAEGIASMRPDLQEALEIRNVTFDQFLSDVIGLECRMLGNAEPEDEQ